MTFRSANRTASPNSQLRLSDLTEGQKIQGRVKKVEEYGLFIQIEGSKLSGLCHKSEVRRLVNCRSSCVTNTGQLCDNPQADVTLALHSFQEGDKVKAVVLSIDYEKRRISLGIKPSYFTNEDFHDLEKTETSDAEDHALGIREHVGGDAQFESDGSGEEDDDDTMEDGTFSMVVDRSDASDDEDEDAKTKIDLPALVPNRASASSSSASPAAISAPLLQLRTGFEWTAKDVKVDDLGTNTDSSDGGLTQDAAIKKKKKRKEIQQDVTADMHTKTPQSISDFERLLLGSPSSSYLWIQYMSFQLQLSEVDKAREVARRALRTINFREEQEKLNIWVALLNLENVYGTDDTLEAVFKEAARSNDSKTVHLRFAVILDQSDKVDVSWTNTTSDTVI
jgi:rRNA biogenesis protein RRP5